MPYDQRIMERQPVLGRFAMGLSYGLPAGVLVAAFLAVMSDDPDAGLVIWVGLFVTVAVALFAMTRNNTKPNR